MTTSRAGRGPRGAGRGIVGRWAALALAAAPAYLATASGAQMRIRIPGLEPAAPSCGPPDARGPTEVERVQGIGIPAAELGATRVVLVSAGDALLLKASASRAAAPATVDVLVKPLAGEGPFVVACRLVPLRPGDSGLLARAPAARAGALWRVEVRTAPSTERGEVGTIDLWRVRGQASDPDWTRLPDPWNNALGLLCLEPDDGRFRSRRVRKGFAGKVRLDVELDDAAAPMDDGQRAAFDGVVLRALSLWATACNACRTEQLAAVRLDGRLLVRRGVAEFLAGLGEGASPPDGVAGLRALGAELEFKLEPVMLLAAGEDHGPTHSVKELEPYERVEPDGVGLRRLCSLAIGQGDQPVLSNVKAALCGTAGPDDRLVASVRVALRRHRTYCGDDREIIACRADEHLTEYNVRDYRFSLGNPAIPPVGAGVIEVDLLHAMLHEMGHWIGLGHIEGGESVMAGGLDRSRCIDAPTVTALIRGVASGAAPEGVGPAAFTLNSAHGGPLVDAPSVRHGTSGQPGSP